MPIQITTTVSLAEVERKLREFEKLYQTSSAEFAATPFLDSKIPEDDAIDWNFLIMQKQTLEEDGCIDGLHGSAEDRNFSFFSRYETTVATQEPQFIYDKVAA
jgi:hypothetical protein